MSSRTLPAFPSKKKLNAEMQHGKTWRTSKPFGAAPTFVSKKTRNAYCVEPEVVELYEPKGRLMVNCRNEAHLPQCPNPGADPKTVAGGGCRVFFFSDDVSAAGPLCRLSLLKEAAQAGETWVNMTARPDLPDPGCKSGTTRYDPAQALLISNIPYGRRFNATNRHDVHAPNPRVNLTIHASTNNGATFPFHKLVWPGQGGYSDLAITPAGAIGIHFVYGPLHSFCGRFFGRRNPDFWCRFRIVDRFDLKRHQRKKAQKA